MLHSPQGSEKGDNRAPTQLLGSVTKKKNEIDILLSNVPENLAIIRSLFTQYLVRVEKLIEACGDQHGAWLSKHMEAINSFRKRVEDVLQRFSEPRILEARSAASSRSSRSSGSSFSRAKIKLAEERAAVNAQKISLAEKIELKESEVKLKARFEEDLLKIEKAKQITEITENENRLAYLEDELEKLT